MPIPKNGKAKTSKKKSTKTPSSKAPLVVKTSKKKSTKTPVKKAVAKKSSKKFTFLDPQTDRLVELTEKQHNFCVWYLNTHGDRINAVVEAGYDVFYRDKNGKETNNINYHLARSIASENLRKPDICAFITAHLAKFGYDDENVELQHKFLINQYDDLGVKQRAISDWYKLKNKYPNTKVDVNHTFDTVEITDFGKKAQ